MVFNLFFLGILIIFSAFFSASETALFSLDKIKVRRLKERYKGAKKVTFILKRPALFLTTIVFGNMLVNIGLSSLNTSIFEHLLGDEGIWFSIVVSGIIILFLGEVFPKILAIYTQEQFALFSAPFLVFFWRVFSPILKLIQVIVNIVSGRFLIFKKKEDTFTEEEIKTALLIGKKEGYITEAEREMINYILKFKDTEAGKVLTARGDIEGIEIKSSQEQVLEILREKRHSKFPVYEGSLDNIVGIIYAKDVFLNQDRNWKEFLRPPLFIPQSKKIDDILKVFLEKGERIAIVLDEHGGTEGLVTLEDIEEEIFGEIFDEFEVPYKMIEKIDENSWRIFGNTPIKMVNLQLELNLPDEENNLASFLLSKLERIPSCKEKFVWEGKEFVVERATAKRIISVILKVKK